MSNQISTAFVKQFSDNIRILSQQKGSRLRNAVETETGLTGEAYFAEQIGQVDARDVTTQFADSPVMNTPHSRRMVTPQSADWGDFIDKFDKVKLLINPESKYVRSAVYAMGRKIDDKIIAAATGPAFTGKNGTTQIALPSTQKIGVGIGATGSLTSVGLNIDKLIAAKSLFGKNDVDYEDPMNKLYFIVSQAQLDDLLAQTQVTSRDYNTVKALVRGEVDTFMGFDFIRTQRLALDINNDVRTCFAFAQSGICLGIWNDIKTRISERTDKSYNWYAYACMTVGATRVEEEKVVEVPCDETPV